MLPGRASVLAIAGACTGEWKKKSLLNVKYFTTEHIQTVFILVSIFTTVRTLIRKEGDG
jgi:hypothetical protein